MLDYSSEFAKLSTIVKNVHDVQSNHSDICDDLDALANYIRGELKIASSIRKKIDQDRKDAKRPHKEAADAVDDTFRPLLAGADLHIKEIKGELLEIKKAQDERERIEAAERRKREEELAASDTEARLTAPIDLATPPKAKKSHIPTRKTYSVRVTDENAIPRAYMTPDLETIEKALRRGQRVPGCELVTHETIISR